MGIAKYLKWINFINVIKLSYYSRSKSLIEHILLWVPETCGVASTRYQIQAWNSLYKDKQHANFIGYYRFLDHLSETYLVLLMNYCVSKELRVLKKNRYMKNLHKKVIIDDTGFRVDNVSV